MMYFYMFGHYGLIEAVTNCMSRRLVVHQETIAATPPRPTCDIFTKMMLSEIEGLFRISANTRNAPTLH